MKNPAYGFFGKLICPKCKNDFKKRRHGHCPNCGQGIRFIGELAYPGDVVVYPDGKVRTYDELAKLPLDKGI